MRLSIVILPEARWSVAKGWWQMADELGFHTAWTYDHLTWRVFRDEPWFGATTTLTAAAQVTKRVRIGTMVASPNFRHPVTFAQEILGLDDISNGRFSLGFGSGGTGYDAEALGNEPWTMKERSLRFVEFAEQLDVLLRNPRTESLRGEYYAAVEARCVPGCVQTPRVPFVISAYGPRGMKLAAQVAQGWVSTGREGGLAQAAEELARFREVCDANGRDINTLDRHYLVSPHAADTPEPWLDSVEAFSEMAGKAAEAGMTDIVVHRPRESGWHAASQKTLEAICARFCSP